MLLGERQWDAGGARGLPLEEELRLRLGNAYPLLALNQLAKRDSVEEEVALVSLAVASVLAHLVLLGQICLQAVGGERLVAGPEHPSRQLHKGAPGDLAVILCQ